MGIKRNIADLITEIRSKADMENTQFISDTEITSFINSAYREAYNVLANSYEDWNLSSQLITTVANTREYAVASDFIRLRKLMYLRDYNLATEREFPCKRNNWSDTDLFATLDRIPRRFQLRGANIRLFPAPTSVLYYRAYYQAAPAALTSSSTAVEFEFGMDRFVVWEAVMSCLIKEKSDTREARAERDRHLTNMIVSSDPRDASEAATVQEVQYSQNLDLEDLQW